MHEGPGPALKINRETLFFPIAIAHRFGPVAATKFFGQVQTFIRLATFFRFGQSTLGRRRAVPFCLRS